MNIELGNIIESKHTEEQSGKSENEWISVLKNTVTKFESFSKDVTSEMLKLELDQKQIKKLNKISFQNIVCARKILNSAFGFDIFSNLSTEEISFINKMFQKRHVYTHNNGLVDQKYLDKTGETGLKIGQLLRIRCDEVKHIINTINKISKCFWDEYNHLAKTTR